MAGLTPVPAGEVATIVTLLEMRSRPPLRPMPSAPLRLVRWKSPSRDRYRTLFRRVGAPWLWFSRLVMPDARLDAILGSSDIHIHAVEDRAGIEVGLLELDFAQAGLCAIAYFGLVPELVGRGHGGWLMAQAMALGWRPGIERITVNTCTLDHPRALGFYRHQGFEAVGRRIESFADPRLGGILPMDAAPHIPILRPGVVAR